MISGLAFFVFLTPSTRCKYHRYLSSIFFQAHWRDTLAGFAHQVTVTVVVFTVVMLMLVMNVFQGWLDGSTAPALQLTDVLHWRHLHVVKSLSHLLYSRCRCWQTLVVNLSLFLSAMSQVSAPTTAHSMFLCEHLTWRCVFTTFMLLLLTFELKIGV